MDNFPKYKFPLTNARLQIFIFPKNIGCSSFKLHCYFDKNCLATKFYNFTIDRKQQNNDSRKGLLR